MAPTTTVKHELLADDFGLDAIARHNAATSTEPFPSYNEESQSLNIYDGSTPLYQDGQSYSHIVPTARSATTSDGVRTRSGRSTRLTDSPSSTTRSGISKSPAPRKRDKKGKCEKSKPPKLTAPLSVLTKDCGVPVRDIGAYVNRSVEERRKEMEQKGYTSRPMNSFMLYRSAYARRTQAWCAQNNHQVVSSLSGESWPMEPEEVRAQFDEWAKIERQHHQEAHPNYKFSPSKTTTKRRKGNYSDDDEGASDLDGDPDGEYRSGRSVKQRRQRRVGAVDVPATVGFDSHPYFGYHISGYERSQHQQAIPGRPPPSNIAYDRNGMSYQPQVGTYAASSLQYPSTQYQYIPDMHTARITTPNSSHAQQSLGGYGLPGGQMPAEDILYGSRTSTPMQQYQFYGQAVYPSYHIQYPQSYQTMPSTSSLQPGSQLYEHQQYLQRASQPQTAIDPSLDEAIEVAMGPSGHGLPIADSHFDDALAGIDDYYGRSGSPTDVNATLAPTWSPTDLKGS